MCLPAFLSMLQRSVSPGSQQIWDLSTICKVLWGLDAVVCDYVQEYCIKVKSFIVHVWWKGWNHRNWCSNIRLSIQSIERKRIIISFSPIMIHNIHWPGLSGVVLIMALALLLAISKLDVALLFVQNLLGQVLIFISKHLYCIYR